MSTKHIRASCLITVRWSGFLYMTGGWHGAGELLHLPEPRSSYTSDELFSFSQWQIEDDLIVNIMLSPGFN